MSVEKRLQSEITKFLRSKKCFVIKTKPGPGTPVGCPDVIFMLEGFWGAIEVKKDPSANYQTLQEETLKKLNNWSWAKRVDPTDWPIIREELDAIL